MSNEQISINNLSKVYDNGFEALKKINLNIKKGEIFTLNNTRSVRPSTGLHPHLYKNLLGSKSLKDLEENSPISEEDF